MVEPERMYIPIDKIHSLPMLASHCSTLREPLGEDAAPRRVGDADAVPPRVYALEAAGRAIATPPVVCELCHKGFRCKEDLKDHCDSEHGDSGEYRKHVFFEAQQHGLHPLEWWQKKIHTQRSRIFPPILHTWSKN